jgi:polyprenyldihydroxybenzoate methyltransferase/3-demethylubiquinol 3-O-methyltransferase
LPHASDSSSSVVPEELDKFRRLSSDWWDAENGSLRGLHSMNGLRVPFVRNGLGGSLRGKRILDVGCGGGILAEPLARLGARVTGLDPVEENVQVARTHLSQFKQSFGDRLNYVMSTIEAFAPDNLDSFDAVVSSEVIEHVTNPGEFVANCARVVKPGGSLFFTTINRTQAAYVFAILAAENLTRAVPVGTHDWNLFVTPGELTRYCEQGGCAVKLVHGMRYNPFTNVWAWTSVTSVNYALHAIKQ